MKPSPPHPVTIYPADRRGQVLLPLASAALLFFAQPPFRVLPLPFLALVPLVLGLEGLPAGVGALGAGAFMGLTFGVAFWGVSLIWVLTEVAPSFSWAYPGYGVLMVLLGGLSALFAWSYLRLRRKVGISMGLALPLAWVGVEWIKGHFPFGLAFPWLGLGVGLTGFPELLGPAEWTGEAGVSFWLAAVNGLVAAAILARRGGQLRPWLVAAVIAVLPGMVGIVRARTLHLEPGPTVAVVGTNVSRELRTNPREYASVAGRDALKAVRQAGEAPWRQGPPGWTVDPDQVDLILLPEATVPLPFETDEARAYRDSLEVLARGLGTPLLVGSQGEVGTENGGVGITNAIFLLSSTGEVLDRYDKVHLVPAMEGGYARGEGARVLGVGTLTVGPLLCYESLFGGMARREALAGADLLVNLSSDVWFGRGEGGIRSSFLRQHPAHLVLRAVENRVPVARAANGGYSLGLDPLGHRVGPVLGPSRAPGVLVMVLPEARGTTLFTRTGDLVGPSALLLALLILALPRSGRAHTVSSGEPGTPA